MSKHKSDETHEEREFRKLSKNLKNSDKIIMTNSTLDSEINKFIRREDYTEEGDNDVGADKSKAKDNDSSDTEPEKRKKHSKKKDSADSGDDDERTYTNRHSDILSQLSCKKKAPKKYAVPVPIPNAPENKPADEKSTATAPATYEKINELTNDVKSFLTLDNEIKTINAKLKELKEQLKSTQDSILVHLDRIGEETINVQDGFLNIKRKQTGGALKKETVETVLSGKIKDVKTKEEIIDSIDEICNANKKVTVSIERRIIK